MKRHKSWMVRKTAERLRCQPFIRVRVSGRRTSCRREVDEVASFLRRGTPPSCLCLSFELVTPSCLNVPGWHYGVHRERRPGCRQRRCIIQKRGGSNDGGMLGHHRTCERQHQPKPSTLNFGLYLHCDARDSPGPNPGVHHLKDYLVQSLQPL